jgi:hypothetical protein
VVERYLDVIELKLKPRFSDAHKFESIMHIIKISVDNKSYARMLQGLRVEGTVGFNFSRMMGDLNAFNRLPRARYRDKLLKKTPWGWVKQSLTKTKCFSAMPSNLTLEDKLDILDMEHELNKQTLIDQELINRV